MSERKIIFYDSGVGGLTTLKETLKMLPNENYVYFADDLNCPYGNKTQKEISELVYRNVKMLLKRYNAKMLVFACNTITTCCVGQFRGLYNIEIVGIEPAILPAMRNSCSKEILCIATMATFQQDKYKKLLKRVEGSVFSLGFKGLAEDIEKSLINNEKVIIDKYLQSINEVSKNNKIDGLVLGCTHYSFLKKEFLLKTGLMVFDGNLGVAKRVKSLLEKSGKVSERGKGSVEIVLSSKNKTKELQYVKILNELLENVI